jgi:N6-L-threonylcarbamoyladenine synthase
MRRARSTLPVVFRAAAAAVAAAAIKNPIPTARMRATETMMTTSHHHQSRVLSGSLCTSSTTSSTAAIGRRRFEKTSPPSRKKTRRSASSFGGNGAANNNNDGILRPRSATAAKGIVSDAGEYSTEEEKMRLKSLPKNAFILGIETSCDDTAAAIVTKSGHVVSQAIRSQVSIHEEWGGVVPTLAKEAHQNAIDDVVEECLSKAGVTDIGKEVSAVAVTVGPGLSMCLRVGVRKAQKISGEYGIPIVPVHHMEAHCLVARVKEEEWNAGVREANAKNESIEKDTATAAAAATGVAKFPFVALLVSGGHNVLLKVEGVGKYTILGQTLDDAIGEAYDKTARLLGLPVGGGGGPALEKLAKEYEETVLEPRREQARKETEREAHITDEVFEKIVQKKVKNPIRFTVPLRKRKTCDFSFAGLKTNVRLAIEKHLGTVVEESKPEQKILPSEDWDGIENRETRAAIAHAFQTAAVTHLEDRVQRALEWVESDGVAPTCLVVAGGVAANQKVRNSLLRICTNHSIDVVFPKPSWCTDNGVMVAWAGIERLNLAAGVEKPVPRDAEAFLKDERDRDVEVNLKPRWPLGEMDERAIGEVKSSKVAKMSKPLGN